ncbi:MAG: hypothetical protein CO113_03480 [Elusimicrobia bacterium CG_4_9_14_3_um_filter_62_55]|nr:MAG: hypothetical protein COX66_13710 [Elusimicrobia bacterium CG_4_10_14_0_2_um_filter_63_34]PJB26455.1 MAG: hypothetical protein CO113_03480 [Elusimicrobia bacterium CG_4_9_14_3_um_filter_62_55]
MKGKASAPASKADVAAVKADLAAVKTELKGDIASVKTELKGDIYRLATAMGTLESKMMQSMEAMQTRSDAKHDRTLQAIDSFLGKLETYDRKSATTPVTLDRHAKQLKEHASRLDKLEASA